MKTIDKHDWVMHIPVISTVHVSKEDGDKLASGEIEGHWASSENGDVVRIPTGFDDEKAEFFDIWRKQGMSEAFIALCQSINAQGFEFIRFDGDGQIYEELQQFDW